jgi:SAM-dependent methyltransferase
MTSRGRHTRAVGGFSAVLGAYSMTPHLSPQPSTATIAVVPVAELDPSVSYWRRFYADAHNGNERRRTFGGALASLGAHGSWLDAGCGIGILAREFRSEGLRVTGVDISAARIAEAATITGLPLADGDAAGSIEHLRVSSVDALPYPDATFDGVYSSSVLEYVPDLGRALFELSRVVKPGGHLVFNMPNSRSLFRRLYAIVRAKSAYSRAIPRWAYTYEEISGALAAARWHQLWSVLYGVERDVPSIPVGVPLRERLSGQAWAAPFVLIAARRSP